MTPVAPGSTELPVYLIHWNAPDWCESAARSIVASQGIVPDLTIIDNGPADHTPMQLPDGVQVIPSTLNLGFAGAANVAFADWMVRRPDSEFCLIGSHDLHVEPDALKLLVDAAVDNPHLGVIAPQVREGLPCQEQAPEGRITECEVVMGVCMLVRRACLDDIGGFDETYWTYAEDNDFCLRVNHAGWRCGVVGSARAQGLGRGSSSASVMMARNYPVLPEKFGGRRATVKLTVKNAAIAAKASVGRLWPGRSDEVRTNSREGARSHWAGVRAALPIIVGLREITSLARPSDDKEPAVTVVISTKDSVDKLREAVASVVGQDFPSWEVIIADNGSDTESTAWCGATTQGRVRTVAVDDQSDTRTKVAAEARGRHIMFLEGDDRLRPTALSRLVGATRRGRIKRAVAGPTSLTQSPPRA